MSGARIDREDRMKKILLGTTALVAAGAFVGAAQADEMMAEPISVGVGGYYHTGLVITADDDDSDRGHALQQNIELEVAGSTTLDNGISVGVRIRVIGNNFGAGATNNTDETEVILSGAFGSIHYGTVEGAAQLMSLWAPGGSPHGGVKSAWFGTSVPWGTASMDEDALKISYYSPAFNGISFGVSYSPEDTTDSYGVRTNNDPGTHGEGIQSAINYSVDVMGGSFSTNVGYETYTSEDTGGADATATRFGASVSIDQISVGGAVQTRTAHDENGDQILSDVGVSWSQGPLSLGYSYGAVDNDSAGNTVINGVGAKYNLGPGIDFAAQFNMVEAPNMAGDGTEESTEILLGTFINF
jgi:outer membrane protein OmpU